MSLITQAPPAAPLELTDATPKLFLKRDEDRFPAMLAVSGSANHELRTFNVNATGKVTPIAAGSLTLTLYAHAGYPDQASITDPAQWLPIATVEPEPIGGAGDPETTSWMIRGTDLLYNLSNGKMQGTFKSNVADHPIPEGDLEHHMTGITEQDPVVVFAIGATFEPTEAPPEGRQGRAGQEPATVLELSFFEMTD